MPNDIFFALADPTRRRILELLADHDGIPASDIYGRFEVSPQAVSQHLKILREAKLVYVEKKAQQRIYRIDPEALKAFEDWIAGMRRRWSSRLHALEAVLKAELEQTKKKESPYGTSVE